MFDFPKSKNYPDCFVVPTPTFIEITNHLKMERLWFSSAAEEMATGYVDVHEKFLLRYYKETIKLYKLFYD